MEGVEVDHPIAYSLKAEVPIASEREVGKLTIEWGLSGS